MKNVRSPDGMTIVARAGYEDEPLPPSTDEFEISERGFFTRRYRCGHRGSWWFILSTYGMKTKKIWQNKECPDCYLEGAKKIIIRCALCGYPIAPGHPVALYDPSSEGIRPDATIIQQYNGVVGCLSSRCCPSGGFFAGNWTGSGVKSRWDGGTIAEAAMRTGEVQSMTI